METYKRIIRPYFETMDANEPVKVGSFIAQGQWADGHLAYSRYDEDGYPMDECNYVQVRGYVNGKNCLYMQRI